MITAKEKKSTPVRFTFQAGNGVQKVQLAGDFTSWKPLPMRKQKSGEYVAQVDLAPGAYQYKFMVDNHWMTDPNNSNCTMNSYGTLNSVIVVK